MGTTRRRSRPFTVLVAFALAVPISSTPVMAGPPRDVSSEPLNSSQSACNAPPCEASGDSAEALTETQSIASSYGLTPILDPSLIDPQQLYDFSADPEGSNPNSFPGGTFVGNGSIDLIGSGWATWNPQDNGKHVVWAIDESYEVYFDSPQQATGVVAEPNLYDWFDITIEAFDFGGAPLGSFTLAIHGLAGAAFIGVAANAAEISSIRISSEPDAGSFAFSDLTYGSAAQAPPVALFVHGYQASFNEVGFGLLLDVLEAEYGGDRVAIFQHYQDAGYRNPDGSCQAQPEAVLPEEPNDGMPVDLDTIDPNLCDSSADLALNATMLHTQIRDLYQTSGARVVVIANSMGAAIVRGMLSYSANAAMAWPRRWSTVSSSCRGRTTVRKRRGRHLPPCRAIW